MKIIMRMKIVTTKMNDTAEDDNDDDNLPTTAVSHNKEEGEGEDAKLASQMSTTDIRTHQKYICSVSSKIYLPCFNQNTFVLFI